MLLSYNFLVPLVQEGVIQGTDISKINSASIDIHLGSKILVENGINSLTNLKYLNKKSKLDLIEVDLSGGKEYCLAPGEFILAQSAEVFNLPDNISAEYKLKSSMARLGLEHLNAGWCDAGWHGSVLTLELKNMTQRHRIVIKEGDGIGQMVFFVHDPVPADKSYAVRGSYNMDKTVSGVKTK